MIANLFEVKNRVVIQVAWTFKGKCTTTFMLMRKANSGVDDINCPKLDLEKIKLRDEHI